MGYLPRRANKLSKGILIVYLTPTKDHWACDIEADGLLDTVTQIWCVTLLNVLTKEEVVFTTKGDFLAWKTANPEAIFVGHNFLSYDAVALNRLWKTRISATRVVDTYLLSQLYNPSYHKPQGCRKGPHSLEAWGLRLHYPKGDWNEFDRYSPEMLRYCKRDTRLAALLFHRLSARMVACGFSEIGCEIEHAAWNIIQNKQKKHGFPLDKQRAEELLGTLRHREEELKDDIYKLWPPQLERVATYKGCRRKDGSFSAQYERHRGQFPKLEIGSGNEYDAYDWVSFNLGSPQQRIAKLIDLGWVPVNWNVNKKTKEKTSPKVDEDELLAFAEMSGREEVAKLAKWIVLNSRANMVTTWLNAYNEQTGAVHGSLRIASTLRYAHSNPNSANIPAARVKKVDGNDVILKGEEGSYTYEARDLWTCGDPSRWSLVGIDGKGIQLRCLAHNVAKMVGVEAASPFITRVLAGDPHTNNIKVLGLANKAAAKKFLYCVPLDSECLTRRGWKKYEELIEGEEILTYSQELNMKEWQPLKAKHYFDEGPIVEIGHSHGFKVRSTPNHRWFTQQRKSHIINSKAPIEIRATEELTTMQNVIVNAELLGDLQSSGIDWTKLPKYGTNWVEVVLQMSQQERRAFLAGFCIADGFTHKNGNWAWTQLDGPLFEAALLASYLTSSGVCRVSKTISSNGKIMKQCSIGKKPHVTTASFTYTDVGSAPVWCPETDNQSWVMRQGDVITITGNTTLMGGGGAKLAVDQAQFGTKLTAREGNKLKDALIRDIPGFKELISYLENQLERTGRITLCDGTPILVPSPHMVIPYLLQGDESRLMKRTMFYVDQVIRKNGWADHVFKVADIHDEMQYKVGNEYVDAFVTSALHCFGVAGDDFKYLIPIEGDAKVGKTWAQTH